MAKEKMIKVRLLEARAAATGSQNAGDVIEVTSEEAKRMFESIPPHAEPVRAEKQARETATPKTNAEKTVEG